MQSDGNSFCGDFVSNSFNKTFRNKDNISDQIYRSKYVRILIVMVLILYKVIRKCIITLYTVTLKPNFMSSLLLYAVFLQIRILFNHS